MDQEDKKNILFTYHALVIFLGSIVALYLLIHLGLYGATAIEGSRAQRHLHLYENQGGESPELFSESVKKRIRSNKFLTNLKTQSEQFKETRELRISISDTYERSYWTYHDSIVGHLQQIAGFTELSEEFFVGSISVYRDFYDKKIEYITVTDYFTLHDLKSLDVEVREVARVFQDQVNTRSRYMAYAHILGLKNNVAAAHDYYRLRYRYSEQEDDLRDFLDLFFQNFPEDYLKTASADQMIGRVDSLRAEIQPVLDVYFEQKKEEREKRLPYVLAQQALWKKRGETPPPAPYPNRFKQIYISLSDQYMFAYEDGDLIMSTPITSGRRDYETVRGTFSIYSKQRGRYLESPFTDDEEDEDYYRLWVDYWMPFYGGYGIHDSCNSTDCWRTVFGGTNYRWAGSHGCINTPHEQIAFLFNWAPVGTTVFVN